MIFQLRSRESDSHPIRSWLIHNKIQMHLRWTDNIVGLVEKPDKRHTGFTTGQAEKEASELRKALEHFREQLTQKKTCTSPSRASGNPRSSNRDSSSGLRLPHRKPQRFNSEGCYAESTGAGLKRNPLTSFHMAGAY
jgi:hypothetical protein